MRRLLGPLFRWPAARFGRIAARADAEAESSGISGGALLVFAHGDVEPDPEASPGSRESIQEWSRSVEIMACRVPESRLQVTIASGVLARKFVRNPIVRMRRSPARRQKLAEVLQLCRQMLFPRTVQTHVHISVADPFRAVDLAKQEIMPTLVRTARSLLEDHLAAWSIPTHPLRFWS